MPPKRRSRATTRRQLNGCCETRSRCRNPLPGSPREEIAKTLNNLAVVCEMTGKLKDAETCYRRAFKIATASLPASDPFVTTSRENLEAFCTAQGLPLTPAAGEGAGRATGRAASASHQSPPVAPPRVASTPLTRRRHRPAGNVVHATALSSSVGSARAHDAPVARRFSSACCSSPLSRSRSFSHSVGSPNRVWPNARPPSRRRSRRRPQ